MSEALLEIYDTLDDTSRQKVDSLIRDFADKRNVHKEYSYEEKMEAAQAIRGIITHEEAEEMRSGRISKFKEIAF